jgi:thiosulfate dehydrogenase [quinone] large subunit
MRDGQIGDPPVARIVFSSTRSAWFWLLVRVWLGVQWIEASLHKIRDSSWVVTGTAVRRFWEAAVAIPRPPARALISYDWYRTFLQFLLARHAYAWFGPVIAYAELAVGLALVLGLLTGVAAFVGGFMNFNYMLAGAASTNPVMFVVTMLVILAWKVAGFYGVDRVLLPLLGTPWQPGPAFHGTKPGQHVEAS